MVTDMIASFMLRLKLGQKPHFRLPVLSWCVSKLRTICCGVILVMFCSGPLNAEPIEMGSAQICLASLIHHYEWFDGSEKPKKSMGHYSHSMDEIHVFKTRFGSVLCRVERNRVLFADVRGEWKNGPEDDFYSFEMKKDRLLIHRRKVDGSFDDFEVYNNKILALLPSSKTCVPVKMKQ